MNPLIREILEPHNLYDNAKRKQVNNVNRMSKGASRFSINLLS